jgi:hypothetical protein
MSRILEYRRGKHKVNGSWAKSLTLRRTAGDLSSTEDRRGERGHPTMHRRRRGYSERVKQTAMTIRQKTMSNRNMCGETKGFEIAVGRRVLSTTRIR